MKTIGSINEMNTREYITINIKTSNILMDLNGEQSDDAQITEELW
jgi:hypothetical protein